jgi:glycosyltransferase involved in cell wall biosynthesis
MESALRQRYGGHQQIKFHGSVFGERKTHLLAQCDVLVVPSIWPEVFGVVIVEGYAYGKPAIGTRAGGIPEIIEDGVTGFLVPTEDTEALAQTLCRVAENRAGLRLMAANCYGTARQYSLETVVEMYVSLYRDLLEQDK